MTTLPRKRHVHVWNESQTLERAAYRLRTLLAINPKRHPDEARLMRWCRCGVVEEARLNPWVRLSRAARPRKPRATPQEKPSESGKEIQSDQLPL